MKTTVLTILSEDGLIHLHDLLLNNSRVSSNNLEITETSTGKIFVNFGGFNGTFTDLWLKKKGTSGNQSRTFIRVSVGDYTKIINELRYKGITPSEKLLELAKKQNEKFKYEYQRTQMIIDNFDNKDIAIEWQLKLNNKNSQARRNFAKNKLIQLGATLVDNGRAREFERKILNF